MLELFRNPCRHHHPPSPRNLIGGSGVNSSFSSHLWPVIRGFFLRPPSIKNVLVSTRPVQLHEMKSPEKMFLIYLNFDVSIYTTIAHTFTIIVPVVAASQSPMVEFLPIKLCFSFNSRFPVQRSANYGS